MSLKTTAVRWVSHQRVSHQNKDFAKDGVRRCDQIPAGTQTPAAL
jgi:hypothetical protein